MVSAIPTFVVDDEPLARKRVMRLLRADPEINVVGTFDSATEAATRARAPQLLLLDIRMPELDGFELVESLAGQGINPYVIFVSAYADRSMDAFAVGAVDYLLKPFDDQRFARVRCARQVADYLRPAGGHRARGAAPVSRRRAYASVARRARQGRGTRDARHRVRPGGGEIREDLCRRPLLLLPAVARRARAPARPGVLRARASLDDRQCRAHRGDASAVSRRL
jgi:CheY-like chemotaxis protein